MQRGLCLVGLPWRSLVAGAVAAAMLCPASGASAQQRGSPDEHASLVERAGEAADAGRYAEARDLLRDALDIHPDPPTAFNLALMLQRTGDLLEARALFERLIAGQLGELPPERLERARELLGQVTAEAATVLVRVTGGEPARVRIDGRDIGTTRPGEDRLRAAADPGSHVLRATSPDGRCEVTEEVELERGEVRQVTLECEPRPPPPPSDVQPASDDPGASATTAPTRLDDGTSGSAWVWVGVVGAILAVGAAAVAVGLTLGRDDDQAPPLPDGYLGTVEL